MSVYVVERYIQRQKATLGDIHLVFLKHLELAGLQLIVG